MKRVSLFFAAAALSFIVTVVPMSCSGAPKACSASTCEGCCDSSGACQYGTTTVACGGKGTICRTCQDTEVCTDGLCLLGPTGGGHDAGHTPVCNENNCAGCCKGDACMSGAEFSSCGLGGVRCEVCNGSQQCTSAGRCQNATCLGCIDITGACQAGKVTTACGSQGFSCVACVTGATCSASGLCIGGSCDGCIDGLGVCRAGTAKNTCGAAGAACIACSSNELCTSEGKCTRPSCDGCVDGQLVCRAGTTSTACGSGGASCVACKSTELCTSAGKCVPTTPPDAGPGSCGPATCPDGCCQGTSCINRTNSVQCGKGGATCASCSSKQTCVAGTCTGCSGCVDVSSGLCTSGTTNTSCGKSGNLCQTCDTTSGQTCVGGVCQGGSCNATTCPTGCCDGTRCVARADQTRFQCGSGTPGTACVSCAGSCDTSAGVCRDDKVDGGAFGDGGFPTFDCNPDAGMFCAPGSCCGSLLGFSLCVTSGTSLIVGEACGSVSSCAICSVGGCNLSTNTCN